MECDFFVFLFDAVTVDAYFMYFPGLDFLQRLVSLRRYP